MADVADVIKGDASSDQSDESAAAPLASDQRPDEAEAPPPPRVRSRSKPPITRAQADKLGHAALDTVRRIAGFVAAVARYGARVLTRCGREIDAMPAALKLFFVVGPLLLIGLVGAIVLDTPLGLICTVVVVPVCSVALGVLGHRWYLGVGGERDTGTAEPAPSDLQRSVEYIDKKLAVALNSFGTERHQQAVIAMVQAKTAVELTLGSKSDVSYGVPSADGGQLPRPRIRLGSTSRSPLQESNSLAAS